jgi:hypothetical protein
MHPIATPKPTRPPPAPSSRLRNSQHVSQKINEGGRLTFLHLSENTYDTVASAGLKSFLQAIVDHHNQI